MPTELTEEAVEKSTYTITISFTDEDGNSVIPSTMVWSLVDINGKIINEREEVSIDSPSTSETIVLTGDDLQILETEARRSSVKRWIVLEGTYNSDAGNNLHLRDQVQFPIINLKKVT